MARDALKVGVAGLGAVGLGVARRLDAGIPGLVLAAVAVRDRDKARRNLPGVGERIPIVAAEALAQTRATSWSNVCRRSCSAPSLCR